MTCHDIGSSSCSRIGAGGPSGTGSEPVPRTWTIMVASWAHPAQMSSCAPKSGKGPAPGRGSRRGGGDVGGPAGRLLEGVAAGAGRSPRRAWRPEGHRGAGRAASRPRSPRSASDGTSIDPGPEPRTDRRAQKTLQRGDVGDVRDRQQLTGGADPGLQGRRGHHLARAVVVGAQVAVPGRRPRHRRAGRRAAPCRCWWCAGWTRPAGVSW